MAASLRLDAIPETLMPATSRTLFTGLNWKQQKSDSGEEEATEAAADEDEVAEEGEPRERGFRRPKPPSDPKDRSRVIPLELSLAYMDSAAYRETYGDKKVWQLYRRNFSKGKTYQQTRRSCLSSDDYLVTGNPCPVCRDEYFVVDYRNVKLISQFIDDYTGRIYEAEETGVCKRQYIQLRIALEKARDHGLLNVDPPFVEYDYDMYRPKAGERS